MAIKRRTKTRGKNSKHARVERAKTLLEERAKRTVKQQLDRLDNLLGKGLGAVKERERLHRQIEEQKQK